MIAVPYFGKLAKFKPLVEEWARCYHALGLPWDRAFLLVDAANMPDERWVLDELRLGGCADVELEPFWDVLRPGHPFDVKGALVCGYLLKWSYPTLVLDADAVLAQNPWPFLEAYADAEFAMPADHGALMHDRDPFLEAPFANVRKLCAGVQWFGCRRENRANLVAAYRSAWAELVALPRLPWSPQLPHLVEQYAWSIAAQRRSARVLPVAFNWAPHFLGASPSAIVNHEFGRQKWV